jgi:DNA-binding CsgD family transcriptional regulator
MGMMVQTSDLKVLEREQRKGASRPGVADLVRQILERVQDRGANTKQQRNGDEPEVVLQVQIEDSQYTLTRAPVKPAGSKVHLSPREKEIVRLVAKGLPNKTIAAVLEISPWTVATHLRRIFGKLQVSSRAEMVARALSEGLIERRR